MGGVHPRVGGETPGPPPAGGMSPLATSSGPSPRGRGNLPALAVPAEIHGSIPAWAGNPARDLEGDVSRGSIPAWAGKPKWYDTAPQASRVHPRVGGETLLVSMDEDEYAGPSPRGRGNLKRPPEGDAE